MIFVAFIVIVIITLASKLIEYKIYILTTFSYLFPYKLVALFFKIAAVFF